MLAAMIEPPSGRGETRIEEPSRAERTVARRVSESRATVPELELVAEADMGAFAARRAQLPGASVTAMLVRAAALALRDVPRANGAYRDGRFELYSRVNIGVAVPAEESFTAPTLFDADRKSTAELDAELRALAARAAAGELTPPEQSGATFTLTNLGASRVVSSSVVITPPHAAALCAGAIRTAPVARDGIIEPGLMMTLTLACDHRILYGSRALRLLSAITERLEHPSSLEPE
jgi:pyruvate dehydrogenase E2 component (dihydrolipoamide acetyltransferase)